MNLSTCADSSTDTKMSCVTCHLSPDHRSMQLQLLWESHNIKWCSWWRFGDWYIREEEKNSLTKKTKKREFRKEPIVLEVSIPLHLGVTGGEQTYRQISLPVTDIATYQLNRSRGHFCENLKKNLSPVTYHVSCVTCYMSLVTCHLTTTLWRCSCYESPWRCDNKAAGGLVKDRERKKKSPKTT